MPVRGSPPPPKTRKLAGNFINAIVGASARSQSLGAAEAYDALRILAASLRQSGPNRARLRDALASVSTFAGASGIISFDHAGNDTSQVTILKLR